MAALETGVDRKADLLLLQEPPGEKVKIGISHPAYEIRKRKRVCTAVRKGSGLATDEWTDQGRGANDDVMVTDIKRRGDDKDYQCVRSKRRTDWRDTREEAKLAQSHATGRWHNNRRYKGIRPCMAS